MKSIKKLCPDFSIMNNFFHKTSFYPYLFQWLYFFISSAPFDYVLCAQGKVRLPTTTHNSSFFHSQMYFWLFKLTANGFKNSKWKCTFLWGIFPWAQKKEKESEGESLQSFWLHQKVAESLCQGTFTFKVIKFQSVKLSSKKETILDKKT